MKRLSLTLECLDKRIDVDRSFSSIHKNLWELNTNRKHLLTKWRKFRRGGRLSKVPTRCSPRLE